MQAHTFDDLNNENLADLIDEAIEELARRLDMEGQTLIENLLIQARPLRIVILTRGTDARS